MEDDGSIAVFAPSPLLTTTIEAGTPQPAVHLHAGGQGLWVARTAATLGAKVTVCCALGGELGMVLRSLIEAEPVTLRAAPAGGPNGACTTAAAASAWRSSRSTPPPGALRLRRAVRDGARGRPRRRPGADHRRPAAAAWEPAAATRSSVSRGTSASAPWTSAPARRRSGRSIPHRSTREVHPLRHPRARARDVRDAHHAGSVHADARGARRPPRLAPRRGAHAGGSTGGGSVRPRVRHDRVPAR